MPSGELIAITLVGAVLFGLLGLHVPGGARGVVGGAAFGVGLVLLSLLIHA